MDRVKTTIQGFEEMIKGGLPSSETYALIGPPGIGKTIFGLQFLYGGIKLGENGVCVTLDETTESLLETGRSFNWDFERFIGEEKLIFLDSSPYKGFHEDEYFIHSEDSVLGMPVFNTNNLIKNIDEAVKKVKARRLFLDCVTMIELQNREPFSLRADLLGLKRALKSLNVTTILSFEAKNGQFLDYMGFEAYISDGVIILGRKDLGDRKVRYIEVLKMRHTSHIEEKRQFRITNEGIIIYPEKGPFL